MERLIDREKVIKGLGHCINSAQCKGCPYIRQHDCVFDMRTDALELLKADQTELSKQEEIIAKLQAALDLANAKLINMGYKPYDINDGRDALHNAIKAAQEPRVLTLYEPTRERQLEALASWLSMIGN